jgi:hypothetical protein
VTRRRTIKKITFSAGAALVLLVSLYLLIGKNLMKPGDLLSNWEEHSSGVPAARRPLALFSQDLIGRALELDKKALTESVMHHLSQQLSQEQEKIDYLFDSITPEALLAGSRGGAWGKLLEFLRSNPSIDRARIVNDRYEILSSTSESDIRGARLDAEVYDLVFQSPDTGAGTALIDEITQSIVLTRRLDGNHALLFYFKQDFFNTVFSGISDFTYETTLLMAGQVVLLNFPIFGETEAENLSNLSKTIREQGTGFLRVRRDDWDKSIYFISGSGALSNWIVGVTFDTAGVQISIIGAVILVVQALVIAAIIIFILSTVRERRDLLSEKTSPPALEKMVVPPEKKQIGVGHRTPKEAGEGVLEPTEGSEGFGPAQNGVVSLSDVEEVRELAEVGEAEVAVEYEAEAATTVEETETGMLDGGPAPLQREEFLQRGTERVSAVEPVTGSQHETSKAPAEMNVDEELEKLEAVQREIMGPEAQMLEELEELGELKEAGEEPEGFIVDDLQNERDTLPELESLVRVEGVEGGEGGQVADSPATGLQGEEKESKPDDELAYLISRIDEEGSKDYDREMEKRLGAFLKDVGFLKGAILLREKGGTYRPVLSLGLVPDTVNRLSFTGGEKFLKNILGKNKILYVKSGAFMDQELRKKFDPADSSSIASMYFAPLIPSGKGLAGFIFIGASKGENRNSKYVLEKLKEIKKIFTENI